MANEFVVRKGLIVSGSSRITGSLSFTAGGVTGSLFGTASWANNAVSSSYATTASYALNASAGSSIEITGSAPSSPTAGDLWYDNTTGKTYIYYTSASVSQWVLQSDPTYNPGPSIQDLQDVTDLNNVTNNAIIVTNTTNAISTLTGALITSGGLGVAKAIVASEITGSLRYSDLVATPSGLISSSTQIVEGLPAGLYSSSAQLPAGIISSSTQLPAGTVSSSAQVKVLLPAGTYSSSAQLPAGTISSSAQLPSGTISSSAQLPAGTISASSQVQLASITGTTFATADFTFPQNLTVAGRLTAEEFHTEFVSSSIIYRSGSTKFGDTADDTHVFTGSLSVRGSISGSLVLPPGTVSASSQVVYTSLSSIPAGIVSSSAQFRTLTDPFTGSFTGSHTGTFPYSGLTDVPSGIISSSAQLPAGTISSSAQLPTGTVSSSAQLPAGIVSSSTQFIDLTDPFTGSFTGSHTGTFPYNELTDVPQGIISSSTQLPSGIISSSLQFDDVTAPFTGSFTGSFVGLATASALQLLNTTDTTATNKVLVLDTTTNKIFTTASVGAGGGGGTGAGFPYSGSAVITGSMYITGSAGQVPLQVVSPTGSILFVTSSAKVGINLDNPQYALHVSGAIFATNDVVAFSDARVKKNITSIENPLELVKQMEGIKFHRIEQDDVAKQQIGFIAQQIKEVVPEVVIGDEQFGYGVSYGNITALLVEAIKAQQQQIDELKSQLADRLC